MSDSRVAIVTGGTYGIGRGITVTLAKKGYRIVAFGLDERQMGSAAEKGSEGTRDELHRHKLSADILVADVSKAKDVQRVVDFAAAKYGRIDALVNNAAVRQHGSILETSEEMWDSIMAVNLKGMFLCAKAVLPHMAGRGGAIVNISSGSGWGRPNRIAYCTSKGGVFAFSSALAYDCLHDHIRVNTVVPGAVLTGMTEGRQETLAQSAQGTVTGRQVLPQDIANTVAFLLSDEAETISGAVISVGTFMGSAGPVPRKPATATNSPT